MSLKFLQIWFLTVDNPTLMVHLQATSACACERAWSTYGYIHNKKRNRLAAPRAEKLVFTLSNVRFLKRVQKIGFGGGVLELR